MVSSVFPLPAHTGGLIRIFQLLVGLSAYHDVVFLSPIDLSLSSEERVLEGLTQARIQTVPKQRKTRLHRLTALFAPVPYHVASYHCDKLPQLVNQELSCRPYDLVYVHFLRSLQYLPDRLDIPVVLDQQNADAEVWRLRALRDPNWLLRLISKVNLRKTVKYENERLDRIFAYVSVSEADSKLTQECASPKVQHYLVAPNGVDTDYYRHCSKGLPSELSEWHPTLVYMGAMHLATNVDAVLFLYREIVPLVLRHLHRLRLLIVGRNPDSRVRKLRSTPRIEVEVTGTVEDVRPYLEKADVFVAPLLYGGGTKLKVLQAMSMQLPVVATPHAAQGLGAQDGVHLMIGKSAEELARKIVELVEDETLRLTVAEAGRRLVEERFSWKMITHKLGRELEILLSENWGATI
jgi:glycosyltransferase involved in cell wall biosynthesis